MRTSRRFVLPILACALAAVSALSLAQPKPSGKSAQPASAKAHRANSDIAAAVRVTATKDCGCGSCAAKGCEACKGKNCYYCVAKGLVVKECGCGMCDAKGCKMCGPGCDVCKFHLAPVAEAREKAQGAGKSR